ncbi:hypothetical protein Tco_0225532 [Tanacetum coccineum]
MKDSQHFPPRPSLYVEDIKRIGAFGGTGELHLLLDRCVGLRARGTCCPPFLLCFENRVNGEWAEGKKVLIQSRTYLSSAGDWGMGRVKPPGAGKITETY